MKSRKATFVLLVSALAFLFALMILYLNLGKGVSALKSDALGTGDKFLGQKELDMYKEFYLFEAERYFLDLSAEYSLKNVEDPDLLKDEFKKNFKVYLDQFNKIYSVDLDLDDYEFSFREDSVIGKCKKELNFTKQGYSLRFKPDFKVYIINASSRRYKVI